MTFLRNPVIRLRLLGIIEGISFLLLLFVAMPLKYFFGFPSAVTVVGLLHGVFFIFFCFALLNVKIVRRWSIVKAAVPLLAALLPGGPFFIDRRLKAEIQNSP